MINRMRETRERNGYSLEEVSSIVRCSPKTLSNYESGKTEKIPFHIVVNLAKLYDIPKDILLQPEEEEEGEEKDSL